MTLNIKKMEADMRWESRKFAFQLALMLIAAAGTGAAVANYLAHRESPPAREQAR